MSQNEQQSTRQPSLDEMVGLFVNNPRLEHIAAYLNRFNPIKVMKMEGMEIRHSAILAWLLDPKETHGFGDGFLKAFLGEALRGHSALEGLTALDVSQGDLHDAEIRCEWKNIDIFIISQTNNWAFVIENKFHSKQVEGQLDGYLVDVGKIYNPNGKKTKTCGIYLTLLEDEDKKHASIKYESVCEILERQMNRHAGRISEEVTTFLNHYLDVLKDATGTNEEQSSMETLARQLYMDHKKVLDFVIEHGASTDFAIAARSLFADNPKQLEEFDIGKGKYVFDRLGNNSVSFLPIDWYNAFDREKRKWSGCEGWWAGFPLICWLQLSSANDGRKGQLKLIAEVGPCKNREKLIKHISIAGKNGNSSRIGFQKGADSEGKKFSRFLKKNAFEIEDIQDPEDIAATMIRLVDKFQPELDIVTKVLLPFLTDEET